ncbi:hypothetical protein FD08_GL001810 [Lentilactobacillus parakefiri DSM 10551]|nr:hypothetical protein FD08_GL001810 [Lentilactobacillus parakefiri DSM 10551]
MGVGAGVLDMDYFLFAPTLVQAADVKNTAQPNQQSDFKWTYDPTNKTATLTGLSIWAGQSGDSANVVIPDTVSDNGTTYKVTEIGQNAFAFQNNMTSVTLPKYLTTIDQSAFPYLDKLVNVDFSQATGLKTIGDQAFVALKQETPITLPDSVTSIASLAFAYAATNQVTLGRDTQEVGFKAFAAMPNLNKVILNASLPAIGAQAFVYDSNLTDVNFTEATSLKTISEGAFIYTGLKASLTLPSSLETIGTQAFAGNQLTKINFDENLKMIGISAFAYNQLVDTITIPKGVTSIGGQAFIGNRISGIDVLGTPTIGTDASSENKITKIANSTGKLASHGAVNQIATATAENATLSIGDLFNIDTNDKKNLDLDLSNLSNNVTYDQDTGKFKIPRNTKQFSFSWALTAANDTVYSGNYTVDYQAPTIPPSKGTATLTDGSKTYDGKKVSQSHYAPTLTLRNTKGVTVATIMLNSDQYVIDHDGSAVGTYQISLSPNEIKRLQDQYPNDDFGLTSVKATFRINAASTPGGNGGGSNVTPSNPSTPSEPSPSDRSSSSTLVDQPDNIAQMGTVVYAVKKIGLYNAKNFSKANRQTWYVQKPRIYRPMFVVTGYTRDAKGHLRYQVRDVNHLTKNRHETGYITADWQSVRPVYYAKRHSTMTVISPQGVNGYKWANLTGKIKKYRQGTTLKVKKVVTHNLTTRFVLTNGQYITGNRKLVEMGHRTFPVKVQAKGTINRYANFGLTKRNQHYAKKVHKVFKVYGFDYSQGNSVIRHGTLRYRVTGGYITGNVKYIKIIK